MPGMRLEWNRAGTPKKTLKSGQESSMEKHNGGLPSCHDSASSPVTQGSYTMSRRLTDPPPKGSQQTDRTSARGTSFSASAQTPGKRDPGRGPVTAGKYGAMTRRRDISRRPTDTATPATRIPVPAGTSVSVCGDQKKRHMTPATRCIMELQRGATDDTMNTALQTCKGISLARRDTRGVLRYDAPVFVPGGTLGERAQLQGKAVECDRSTALKQVLSNTSQTGHIEGNPARNHLSLQNGGRGTLSAPGDNSLNKLINDIKEGFYGSLNSLEQGESSHSEGLTGDEDSCGYSDICPSEGTDPNETSSSSSSSAAMSYSGSVLDDTLNHGGSTTAETHPQNEVTGKLNNKLLQGQYSLIDNISASDDHPSERFMVNICKAFLTSMDLNGAKASEKLIKKLFTDTFSQITTAPLSDFNMASDESSHIPKIMSPPTKHQEKSYLKDAGGVSALSDSMVNLKNEVASFKNSLINYENFKRKNNLKIRGIPESIKKSQLGDYISSMISHLFPDIQGKNLVEKTFRIRRPSSLPSNLAADVIVSFYPNWLRDSLLDIAREPRFLSSPYGHLAFYRDLCKDTLQKRRLFRHTTHRLQQAGIQYNWYQSSNLRFHFASKWYTFSSSAEAAVFLNRAGINMPRSSSGPTSLT